MIRRTRFKTFEFWDGALFGAAFLSVASFLAAIPLLGVSSETGELLSKFASVVAALVAASIAFLTVQFRLNFEKKQDLASARAVFPLALTRLSSICDDAMSLILTHSNAPQPTLTEIQQAIALDDEIVTILRDNIRAADPQTREWIALIISHYQVAQARSKGWWNKPNRGNALYERELNYERRTALFDWATIHALVGHHFNYARGASDQVREKLNPAQISSAILFHSSTPLLSTDDQNALDARVARLQRGGIADYRLDEL